MTYEQKLTFPCDVQKGSILTSICHASVPGVIIPFPVIASAENVKVCAESPDRTLSEPRLSVGATELTMTPRNRP